MSVPANIKGLLCCSETRKTEILYRRKTNTSIVLLRILNAHESSELRLKNRFIDVSKLYFTANRRAHVRFPGVRRLVCKKSLSPRDRLHYRRRFGKSFGRFNIPTSQRKQIP